jgi:divalent metal cation (Fe/Co/Zn/Cd) transporter
VQSDQERLSRGILDVLWSWTDGTPRTRVLRQVRRAIISSMATILQIPAVATLRRIQRIQTITIIWMSVEAAVSLSAAWIARSPALLAFGGDSAIELLSAAVVLRRFRAHVRQAHAERRAGRIAGGLLFILAAFVVSASILTLLGHSEPRPTYLGVAILLAAASIMPWLAKEKRKLSAATGSAALRADSAQSALCAYLSLTALLELGVNAIWHITWADPVAAMIVTPLILWEGQEAIRGNPCGCSKITREFGCAQDSKLA